MSICCVAIFSMPSRNVCHDAHHEPKSLTRCASLLTGIRTEEARALRWSHVVAWADDDAGWVPVTEAGFDHERFAIYVWRSVRANGDTKTEKPRRTLELPAQAAEALREHRTRQTRERLAADPLWRDHGLVFASQTGTPPDVSHVRRAFKAITKKAGLGENWTPRELRHTFVSLMSDNGVPIQHGGNRGGVPASAQAGDHQGCRDHEHHLQPAQPSQVRVSGRLSVH
jgi:integrase